MEKLVSLQPSRDGGRILKPAPNHDSGTSSRVERCRPFLVQTLLVSVIAGIDGESRARLRRAELFWYVRLNADALRILVRAGSRKDMQPCCRNSARIWDDQPVRCLMQDTMIVATATCPVGPAGGGRQWNSSFLCSRCSLADPSLWHKKLAHKLWNHACNHLKLELDS